MKIPTQKGEQTYRVVSQTRKGNSGYQLLGRLFQLNDINVEQLNVSLTFVTSFM